MFERIANLCLYKTIYKPINEITFKWYDSKTNEVEFGKHIGYLWEIYAENIDTLKVKEVELPKLNYGSLSQYPLVKITLEEIYIHYDKLTIA
jgi:hypothetical protein